ncbi:MAG: protoporphyrinogen oxidase HemJ [Roseiarcus sp.]|jgi:putative membrane protein
MQSPDLWLKTLHILAVISWMAGMLYLPRLFVYHADAKVGSELSETFKVMERRLLNGIVNPAMVVVWLTGAVLAYRLDYFRAPWLDAKLVASLALLGINGYLAATVWTFAKDRNRRSALFYRVLNETPTVLMIVIVILVVFKPL